ncbi:anti-sigma factor family protein [Agromyces soli]
MTPEHARYADWDSAYVLGALEPGERREYEAHLERCDRCRLAVAELAAMPGLLSRLGAERASALLADAALLADPADPAALAASATGAQGRPDAALREALRLEGRRRARRSRIRIAVLASAAAIVVLVAIGLPGVLAAAGRGAHPLEFTAVAELPVSASATLEPVAWGTRIELDCSYAAAPGVDAPDGGWTYGLFAVGRDGTSTQLSTWRAAPGATARLEAGTALAEDEIASLEIRAMGSGDVLLRARTG